LKVAMLVRGRGRMRSSRDGVLLAGRPNVPAHRVKDVDAAHTVVAGDDVGRRIALRVSDVQPLARRVREHVEHVALRAPRVALGAERLVRIPVRLPFRLDDGRIVTVGHDASI
jgi:hypothetical protein